MKIFKFMLATLFAIIVSSSVMISNTQAYDGQGFSGCAGISNSAICKQGSGDDLQKTVLNVINTLFFIVGILSVIIIIVSGIMFVTSAGNADTVKKAKSALTYSVVGLVVALLAYAIVNFVVNSL